MNRILLFVLLLITGCQSPMLVFPGKELTGDTGLTESFSVARQYKLLRLEVNPDAPYSVILRTTIIDGELYVDAAPGRKWGKYIAQNNQVKVKLGNTIYPGTCIKVQDQEILNNFLKGRSVYRIDPVQVTQ